MINLSVQQLLESKGTILNSKTFISLGLSTYFATVKIVIFLRNTCITYAAMEIDIKDSVMSFRSSKRVVNPKLVEHDGLQEQLPQFNISPANATLISTEN